MIGCTIGTVQRWVCQQERHSAQFLKLTSTEEERIEALERDIRERQSHRDPAFGSAFFVNTELDCRYKLRSIQHSATSTIRFLPCRADLPDSPGCVTELSAYAAEQHNPELRCSGV